MICTECKSRNPLGNKFCRDCGAKLVPPEGALAVEETARVERERVHERVAGLLSAAFTLSEQKRYEQAIPLAEEAALLLPESTSAHGLLASLYERTDQEKKAIAAMERVVALNPESAADQEKLDQLRRGVHVLPRTTVDGKATAAADDTAAARRRNSGPAYVPFVLAGTVSACVLGLGLSLINRSSSQTRSDGPAARIVGNGINPGAPTAAPTATLTVPTGAAGDLASAAQQGFQPPASQVRADPFATVSGIQHPSMPPAPPASGASSPLFSSKAPAGAVGSTLPAPPTRGGFRLPRPTSTGTAVAAVDAGPAPRSLPPIIAVPPPSAGSEASGSETASTGGVRIPARPSQQNNNNGADTAGQSGNGGDGYIRISVGPPPAVGLPPRPAPPLGANATEGGSPLARARRLQSANRYVEAIAAYQEALSGGGGSVGDIYQGIGQCYQRQGDDPAARSAYHEAIRAYESQAASGRNVSAAQRGVISCKAALEAIGG